MYSSTFIFAKREFDDEFHALDQVIAEAAKTVPGYLGEESWESPANGLVCNVYYWQTMASLQALMSHPAHMAAKQRRAKWLAGYQVVIGEVIGCYGDRGLQHPLAQVAVPLRRATPSPLES